MFTRENTKQVKGIAILLMLIHHLYLFTDRIPYGMSLATKIYVSGKEFTQILGDFGKFCVPLYMFLGGYGLYIKLSSIKGEQVYGKNSLVSHYIKLYTAYWKVFLIFIPIGFIFFSNQSQYCNEAVICNRFANFFLQEVILEFIGLRSSIVSEWWFFLTYLFALFAGFVFWELFKKNKNVYVEFAVVIIWYILTTDVFTMMPWTEGYVSMDENPWFHNLCVNGQYSVYLLLGMVFAKYKIYDAWNQLLDKLKKIEKIIVVTFVLIMIVDMYVFLYVPAYTMLLIPIFVFSCAIFIEETVVFKKVLMLLGEHSTNMWLIHGFYCYYFEPVAKFVYSFNNAIISLLIFVILTLASSYLVNMIWKVISMCYVKIREKVF